MSTHAQAYTPASILALGYEAGFDVSVATRSPLQLEWSTQLVATAAMVVLVVLGGMLLLRNRLDGTGSGSNQSMVDRQEFKTDREKICELVDENGGRMKQSEIVNSVDWSKAKVSRLLAELEEDDQLTKLRLGRENLICLPGHEPPASKSTDGSDSS